MDSIVEINDRLKWEAKAFYERGLNTILIPYGEVVLTGSYDLDVMAWRDLDILIDVSNVSQQAVYDISKKVFDLYQPVWFETRNTFHEESGCPKGYFLGFESRIINGGLWNVDIWFTNKEHIEKQKQNMKYLKSRLTDEKRALILEIKKSMIDLGVYGATIFSIDIYQAVLEDNVSSHDRFKLWLKLNKGLLI